MSGPGEALWRFAVAVYEAPGAANACLLLQDRHGVNVNVLLAALYAVRHGTPLTAEDLAALDAAVAGWQRQVVEPLRAVRRAMKAEQALAGWPGAKALREAVKAAELEAERLTLATLARRLAAMAPAAGEASVREAIVRTLALHAAAFEADAETAAAIATLTAAAASVDDDL
ncbi:MAG TPA: TIGR02444 family protein [Hyphomicrobiales bacterium]|nr:TIGR02444 family protein [Hyphomicrobiales bacterium]